MRWILIALIATVAFVQLSSSQPVASAGEAKITDPNTVFHRLFVAADGKKDWERDNFNDDLDDAWEALDQLDGPPQAAGGTTSILRQVDKQAVIDQIHTLQTDAQPGQEVTLYFVGHGNERKADASEFVFNLKPRKAGGELLLGSELKQLVEGFNPQVTISVILDSCFGGELGDGDGTHDVVQTMSVQVIGPTGKCPSRPFLDLGQEKIPTLSQRIKERVKNDPTVTAAELKAYLTSEAGGKFDLESTTNAPIKDGNSKCTRPECNKPEITVNPPSGFPGPVTINGEGFQGNSAVLISTLEYDLTTSSQYSLLSNPDGTFSAVVPLPSIPILLTATDGDNNQDSEVFDAPVGGIVELVRGVDSTNPSSDHSWASTTVGAASVLSMLAATLWYARRRSLR